MVKKSALAKKLAAYSAVAAAVLAVNHETDAQIIYTGLNPDIIIPDPIKDSYDTSVYLDLNNDGIADFKFEAAGKVTFNSFTSGFSYSSIVSIQATGLHKDSADFKGVNYGNAIPGTTTGGWASNGFLAKDSFRNKIIFTSSTAVSSPAGTYGGSFYNVTGKYLPLKFKNNGNTYYGWVRLTTIGAKQLIISAYAYNSIPDSSISAGNMGCTSTPITPVVTQKNNVLTSSTADKYQWYFDGIPIAGDTLAALTPSQRGYYAVLTKDVNGCLAQSLANYFACYSVNPEVSENSDFSNPSCGPAELQAVNLVSGTYIQWLLNGVTITGATSPAYFADSTASYSAAFIDSDKTCSVLSDTVQLTIKSAPPLPSLKQACDTLTSAPTTGAIMWYYEKVSSDSLINDTINRLIPVEKGNYIVDYSYTDGCSTADTLDYQSPFSTAPPPVIATTNNSDVLCYGEPFSLSLTDSMYYNQHGDSIQWYLNDTAITAANKTTYNIDTSGTYYLSITSGACYKYSDTVIITEDIEHPVITQLGTDTLATQIYTSYQWYDNGVKAANGTAQYYTAATNGTYYVIVTDSLGCSFQSPDYDFINTGISSAALPGQVSVYSYDKIVHVQCTDETLLGSSLSIYNMMGQKFFSTTVTTAQTEIDMKDFPAGLYVVEVRGKKATVIKKIVIE